MNETRVQKVITLLEHSSTVLAGTLKKGERMHELSLEDKGIIIQALQLWAIMKRGLN